MTYALPSLPSLRLRVVLEAGEPARLPPYKGSMLRGAFGHALRRAACAMGPDQACASCRLRSPCVYTRLFETYVDGEPPPFLKGLTTAPRPYVFEPADEEYGRRDYAPGDGLRFDLVLLGQAVDLEAYALLAIERMARAGLGRSRQRFGVRSVEPVPEATPGPPDPGAVTLRFTTPTRFTDERGLMDRFSFRELTFRALRRVLELAHFHGDRSEVDWHFRPLLEQADGVEIVRRDLRWHDWSRWSNRQKTSVRLGGVVGEMVLAGELTPFTELLRRAELVHVGKGATLGMGRVEVASDTPHHPSPL